MVAKIISGKRIKGILHYNENKVALGQAQLIMASGFAGEIDQMNFDSKVKRFEKLTMLSDWQRHPFRERYSRKHVPQGSAKQPVIPETVTFRYLSALRNR